MHIIVNILIGEILPGREGISISRSVYAFSGVFAISKRNIQVQAWYDRMWRTSVIYLPVERRKRIEVE